MTNAYTVTNPDFTLSPYSGMNKAHYIECARHLLDRAFQHVQSIHTPFAFPVVPGKTYPQPNDPPWRWRSFEFEALERTLTLAGPLMHVDPETEIRGIKLREYYCEQLYTALTPGHPNSLPLPEDLPDATYQFTCEFGGLFKTLLLLPDIIWPYYTQEQKDAIALTVSKWAHHRTTQNNWRIFNIMALSFLKKNGYAIDDELLKSHLLWVVSYHSGSGWYLEQTYNYYTISLFVVYGTIWTRTFGDQYYPEIAAAIEASAHDLMKTYANFFGRDGYINMWARSICYRTWISGGFPISFMLQGETPLDPGLARRLCSGSILQFVTREDFFENGIPSLGFYGHREFIIQNYSCPASPFLMFLPFLCLALPDDSPFWTAVENEGFWDSLDGRAQVNILEEPGLALVNYGASGTSEIIPGKVYYEDHNYSKLAFNTHFPWEDHNPQGGTSMEYSFRSLDPRDVRGDDINFYLTGLAVKNDSEKNASYTTSQSMLYNGTRGGVIYRQAIMRKPPNNGVGYIIDLADIILPNGILRIDRSRMAFEHELTLGHYGLPHENGVPAVVRRFTGPNGPGITAAIPGRQTALIAYGGWDSLDALTHVGCNVEAEESTVLFAHKQRMDKNPPMELMITALLHKTDDSPWSDAELDPIQSIEISAISASFSPLSARITLRSGEVYEVDFACIDGKKAS